MSSPAPSSDGGYGEPPPSKPKKRNPPAEPRKLVRWNPDTDQLLLLGVDAVCTRLGVALPWDDIAKEVEDFVSAEGVKQHIGKVRLARAKFGRKVPDKPEKKMRRKNRAKEAKAEEEDEADKATTTRLASLLYHGPETQPKPKKTPKKPKAPATTPGDSSRSCQGRKKVKSSLDREAVLGLGSTGSPTKTSTGKRGRKTKVDQLKEGEEEFEDATPTKRQRQYELRAITNEVKYDFDEYDSDDDVVLADQDQGDEYREDGDDDDEAEDDKMEDIKGGNASSPQKNDIKFEMAPPPPFNYNQASMGSGDVNPSQYETKMQQQFHSNSTFMIQPNPLHVSNYSGPMFSYGNYGNVTDMPPPQDPFGGNNMASDNPGMTWLQASMMPLPRPEESAMRSSLTTIPRTAQKEEDATNSEARPTKSRKGSKQQDFKTPEKKKTKANQEATPADQTNTPVQGSAGSPFDSVDDVEKAIDTSNAVLEDTGMNNYSYSMGAPSVDYYAGNYFPGTGVGNYGINYGNGMNNSDLRVQTDQKPAFGGMNAVISPDTYTPAAFSNFPAAPANSPIDANFAVNMSSLPMYNNTAINNPLYSQASSTSMTPAHSTSFDSTFTSIHGSQTEESNQNLIFNAGNDDQTQQDHMDFNHPIFFDDSFNSMPGGHDNDLFGGAGF